MKAMPKHTPIQLPLAIESVVVEIPLTKGYIALVDTIDADLSEFIWTSDVMSSGTVYAKRREQIAARRPGIKMHRVIMERMLGGKLLKTQEVDHVNGNGCDNRRSNLRLATHQQNMQNQKTHSNNSSGVAGVYWRKDNQKWRAIITIDAKAISLGQFPTRTEAVAARQAAEMKYWGEFSPTLSRAELTFIRQLRGCRRG